MDWQPVISFEELVREIVQHDLALAEKDKQCNVKSVIIMNRRKRLNHEGTKGTKGKRRRGFPLLGEQQWKGLPA